MGKPTAELLEPKLRTCGARELPAFELEDVGNVASYWVGDGVLEHLLRLALGACPIPTHGSRRARRATAHAIGLSCFLGSRAHRQASWLQTAVPDRLRKRR